MEGEWNFSLQLEQQLDGGGKPKLNARPVRIKPL